MTNNKDMNSQFNRMKELMNFGLNESKKQPYTGLEYSKVGADGKNYAIIREGTNFYIKVSDKKENVIAEDFKYIGGFRNRKENQYDNYAAAQKNFDFKLRSLAEAYGNGRNIVIESWNPEKQEELSVEATEKMKKEISRERQIMENAAAIYNRKTQNVVNPINEACEGAPFCEDPDKEFKDSQKDNVSGKPEGNGDAKKANKDYKNASIKGTEIQEGASCPKCGKNPCECGDKEKVNEEEVLGWNRDNDDYMDKSHGTEIGDSAPFDGPEARNIDDGDKKVTRSGYEKQGTIHEEDTSMIYTHDNQNKPTPGVGEVGDNEPFDGEKGRQIDEAIDDLDAEPDLEDGDELGLGGDDLGGEDDLELGGEEDALGGEEDAELGDELAPEDDAVAGDDLESRVSSIEDLLNRIADKLGVGTYDDDNLYDDEGVADDGLDGGDDLGVDDGGELGGEDLDAADGDTDLEDEETVYESKAYKNYKLKEAIRRKKINESGMESFKDAGRVPSDNMNKLDDFGKHPAYQKHVMSLPPKDLQEFPDYYDMNDESVKNDSPYGEKIGDGSPFNIDPEAIENAISESIIRFLKKNK